jgi:predicted ATPase
MITRFRVQNYKALRDVTLDLTPIHVLIGPNDSGKTSILEAIAALCRSVNHSLPESFTGSWEGQQLVWQGTREVQIGLSASVEHEHERFDYCLACSCAAGRDIRVASEEVQRAHEASPTKIDDGYLVAIANPVAPNSTRVFRVMLEGAPAVNDLKDLAKLVYDSLLGVHLYRWDARFLALPVAPDRKRLFRMEPSGFGLALCLDDILGYDRDRFISLENRFKNIFPHIKSIKLIPELAYKSPVDDPEQIPMLQKSDEKGSILNSYRVGN